MVQISTEAVIPTEELSGVVVVIEGAEVSVVTAVEVSTGFSQA
ncbi:MAG: hypothetical protein AABY26_06860 [Nanoarchaeota archaeon]